MLQFMELQSLDLCLRPQGGSQGASRAAPGKSGLHERGEGERVIFLA